MATLLQIACLFSLWVIVPLIPAVLIYKVFPNSVVTTSGKLAGLTVKATGAFAGYLIVFTVTYPLIVWGQNLIKVTKNTYWRVRAPVELDTTGATLDSTMFNVLLERINAEPIPNNSGLHHGWLELLVPDGQNMVGIYLYGPCVLPKNIYLTDKNQVGDVKRDSENQIIEFSKILKIGPLSKTCDVRP